MERDADIASGQLPLKDVVLCCTSLPQDVRTNLADVAAQMGALHKLDLTSDVTHLIVGSITTPKYRYVAKERPDIKVVAQQWVEAVRQSWMEGGDVDVSAFEMKYFLPPLAGLDICVTGFENLEQRNYVSQTIEKHGAKYHPDLTKNVTHLIARRPEGAKYNAAKQWSINIVSLKWLEDSIYRGMALDESLYDPVTPDEVQGRGAFRRHARARTSLGKHGRDGEGQNVGGGDASKKRLRRTASTRLESQSQDMWQDMSAHEVHVDRTETDQWQENDASTTDASEIASKKSITMKTTANESDTAIHSETTAPPDALFSGCYVLVSGFDRKKTELLQKVLEQNGARLVKTTSDLEDASRHTFFSGRYVLIPHDMSSRSSPDVPASTTIATEWWIERCLQAKRLLDPVNDVLSTPLGGVEVSAFAELVVSTTGFSSLDVRQAAQAVELMGAKYQQDFGLDTSVLVSGSASIKKEKAFYARKHHIPVVSADWLWTWLTTKQKTSYEKFEVALPALDLEELSARSATVSPAPSNTSQKAGQETSKSGKGDTHAKHLSKNRQKHVTPTLPLHAVKAEPLPTLPKPQPILHDNDDDSPSFDSEPLLEPTTAATSRKGSHPLQDVSPNRSPRKTSEKSKDESVETKTNNDSQPKLSGPTSPEKLASPPICPQIQPPSNDTDQQSLLRPRHELAADLSELLNRQTASRPNSAGPIEPQQRRKHRPLGRAPSGISNRSLSATASAQSENDISPALPAEASESAADGFSVARDEPLPPSTQLGYETAEAEALNKKIGAKLQDGSETKRVANLGTVKDTSLSTNSSMANRGRNRQRTK